MKKILHSLPALAIAVAALLCLSFDNNSKLSFTGNNSHELFQSTTPSGRYKAILEQCPWGHSYIDCQTGGSLACTPGTCPAGEHDTDPGSL